MEEIILWSPGVTLEAIEKQAILKAFRFYRGNKTATANALGIAIRTLDAKLEQYEANGKADKDRQSNERQDRNDFLDRQRNGSPEARARAAADAKRAEDAKRAAPTEGQERVQDSHRRTHMESTAQPATKHEVSMPKPKEVQGVLPAKSAVSGSGKSR